MALDVGQLVARLTLDRTGFDRGLNESQSAFSKAAGALGSAAKYVGAAAAGAITTAGVIGIKTAAQMETARIGFTTMLGSAQKADAFLRQLQTFAAQTPFEFPELQTAASSLISIGIESSKVIPIMTTLGNVTSGMGTGAEGVQRATVAIQQMNAAGKIQAQDLNQLRDAGIPVYDLLASALGKTKSEVADLANKGKLGKDALDKMMSALETGKGLERFSGLMDKQSQSLSGLWSTMHDTITMGLATAIAPMIPLLKDGLGGAIAIASRAMPAIASGLTAIGTIGKQVFGILFHGDFTHGPLSEDSRIVDVLFRLRDGLGTVAGVARQAYDVLFRGDFTHGPLSEDSRLVDVLFRLRDAFMVVGDYVRDHLTPILTVIGGAVGGELTGALAGLAALVGGVLVGAVVALVSALASPVVIIGALVGALIYAYTHFTRFREIVANISTFVTGTLWPALKQVGAFLIATFTPTVRALVDAFQKNLLPALLFVRAEVAQHAPQFAQLGRVVGIVAVVVEALVLKLSGFLLPILIRVAGFLLGGLFEALGVIIGAVGQLISVFGWLANKALDAFGLVLHAAADAFGWVPGVGGKLKDAASKFDTFRDDVNSALGGIKDKQVTVTAITDVTGAVQASNSRAFHAAGGAVSGPGSGTSDSVPAMLSNGEHVITAHEVQKAGGHGAIYAMRSAIRGYATGGAVGVAATASAAPIASGLASWYSGVVSNVTAAGQKQANASAAAYSGPMPTGDAVTRWAPLVGVVLNELGLNGGLVAKVLRQIKTESGGNPNATQGNIGDVNNRSGDLARGLMQVIGATFRAYAGPYLRLGQYDPHASIYAGLNYAKHRYGPDLSALGQGHGYDSGGVAVGKGLMAKGTIRPERVLSPRQTESFERLVDMLGNTAGDGRPMNVHVYIGGEKLDERIAVRVDSANVEQSRALSYT